MPGRVSRGAAQMLAALGVSIQLLVPGHVQFAATLNHEFRVGPHPCFDIIL